MDVFMVIDASVSFSRYTGKDAVVFYAVEDFNHLRAVMLCSQGVFKLVES